MVFGNANTLLSHTTVLRIIDSPTPTEPITIAGQLGVDNSRPPQFPSLPRC